MLFLGISELGHDPAVAVVGDNGIVSAIEERKLVRAPGEHDLPHAALAYGLREAGVTNPADLTGIATAGRAGLAHRREARLRSRVPVTNEPRRPILPAGGRRRLDPDRAQALQGLLESDHPIEALEHHLCHAASAFYPSDADRALVITLDRSGDMWSGLVALGEGRSLEPLESIRFPDSLGLVYSDVTARLGFRPQADEHKTQWLSAAGTPDLLTEFRRLISPNRRGLPRLDRQYLTRELGGSWRLTTDFYTRLGLPEDTLPDQQTGAAVARSVQDLLEETVIALAERYRRETGTTRLCVAGGVFLNGLLVRALEDRTGFSSVFVQPAAGNPGTAIGAAYLAQSRRITTDDRRPLTHLFLGPASDASEIKAVLDNCKVVYRYLPERRLVDQAVTLLSSGNSVGWYQDRMEFGHRALGNRSILASPFSPYVTENLNAYIKHREAFHPFVLAVPAEVASRYFDAGPNCRHAASVARVRSGIADFDAFMFGDRLVRLHVVEPDPAPRFWRLLRAFGEQAPAPVLVNTSFNLFGESLVCTPRDAVRTFYCSGVDALVLGDFLLVK